MLSDDFSKAKDEFKSIAIIEPRINPYMHLVPICFIYYLVLFMILPLSSQVVISLVCEQSDVDDCSDATVSSKASLISLYSSLALNIPALLLAGPYGSFGDKFGRRFILLVPLIGLTACMCLYSAVAYFRFTSFFFVLLAANFIQGCSGGGGVFQMGIFTYAADVTENHIEERTTLVSVLESTLFFAKILGPILGGIWAETRGFSEPIVYGCGVLVLICLWAYFTIPESLSRDSKVREAAITYNPIKTVKNLYYIFKLKYEEGRSPLPFILIAYLLVLTVVFGNISILTFYVITKFHWSSETIGYYLALEGGIQATSMLFLPILIEKLMNKKFDNVWWIAFGYLMRSMSYLAIGLSSTTSQIFLCTILLVFTGPYYPRNRVLLTNSVTAKDQSIMQSAIAAIDSLGSFIHPLITLTYSLTVGMSPSIVYYVMACIVFISFLIVLFSIMNPSLFINFPESRERKRANGDTKSNISVYDPLISNTIENSNEDDN